MSHREGAFLCGGGIIISWKMRMMTPPKMYVGEGRKEELLCLCVCLFLLSTLHSMVPLYQKRKKGNPWSYVKIIMRFGFTNLSIRIGTWLQFSLVIIIFYILHFQRGFFVVQPSSSCSSNFFKTLLLLLLLIFWVTSFI